MSVDACGSPRATAVPKPATTISINPRRYRRGVALSEPTQYPSASGRLSVCLWLYSTTVASFIIAPHGEIEAYRLNGWL